MALDLRKAIKRTLAERTAVICVTGRYGRPLGKHLVLASNGVADLAGRRASLHGWVDLIWDGTTEYVRDEDGRWARHAFRQNFEATPFWPLFRTADEARLVGVRTHRGRPVERYGWTREVPQWAPSGRVGRWLERREGPKDPRDVLEDVEVWLDAEGRIRLAARSTRIERARGDEVPVSPAHRFALQAFGAIGPRPWTVVELVDFGSPATIRIPAANEIAPSRSLRDVTDLGRAARALWRERAEIRAFFRRYDEL